MRQAAVQLSDERLAEVIDGLQTGRVRIVCEGASCAEIPQWAHACETALLLHYLFIQQARQARREAERGRKSA